MKIRLCVTILTSTVLLSGCLKDKRKSDKARVDKHHTDKPPIPTKDQSGDVTFQGFVGQLKIAVAKRDRAMLASMMAPNFGYRWDDGPPGEDPFTYWDRNNLWSELQSLMSERWVPYDGFMVVPMQLSTDDHYSGFRAGVQQVNGAWRFAYFVPAPPKDPADPAPSQL